MIVYLCLPLPAQVVTADRVARGKPDPACYTLGAELLGLGAAETLVFEDAAAGIRSGLAAGARVIVVGGYAGPETEGLPRLRDYTAVRVASAEEGFTLAL